MTACRTSERAAFGIGEITQATVADSRLRMLIEIDPDRARALGAAAVVERLERGESLDVSVGAHVSCDETPGTHRGKPYRRRWTTMSADHLAVVPRGACGQAVGCFMRAAELVAYIIPDPYGPQLAQLRAACQKTPERTYAERYKAERKAEYEAEYAASPPRADAPVITPAELAQYAPPNSYQLALDRLKESR